MSAEEELREQIEKVKEPFEKNVAATMAILAAFLAVVSVLGHIMTTEELLAQQKASDQWAYYQAKSIRRYQSEVARDLFAGMNQSAQSAQYQKNAEKYRSDNEEIQREAQGLERESDRHGRRALRLHFGEVFLEFSIVFASLAIITKRRLLWYVAIAGGVVGTGAAATTWFVA
jgi:signal transduction histidine kinase